MPNLKIARVKWWLGFLLSAFLPLWLIAIVLNFGGWIVEDLDYGFYELFVFLSFMTALVLSIHFLRKPDRFFGLRFATGWVLGILLTLGSCTTMVSSSCGPETMRLGKMWSKQEVQYGTAGGCDAVALTNQSTRTR
ncbi:hypothetical protein AAKU64_000666 [Undibacterium sp. GrIS 1.8]|uniref:hypothetical protein n=1 Tax=Undibacterium sp. GrIS 1.8 TaxID=3143934 RepID=UPI003394CCB4